MSLASSASSVQNNVSDNHAVVSDDVTKKYKKLTLLEQVLLRPGMYIGDVHQAQMSSYIFDREKKVFRQEQLVYVPALYKVIDEVVSNSCDQYIRLKQLREKQPKRKINHVRNISFDVNTHDNSFTVFNDGEGIEIQIHENYQIYVPELIFGNLLTGSNYDDTEDRLTIGTNGMGVKLCNIFARRFEVETVDAVSHQRYVQVFENNMRTINPPQITPCQSAPYTRVTVHPDFAYFGLEGWTPDMVKILERRTYDISICTGSDVNVSFNGERVHCDNFEQLMDLFEESQEGGKVYENPHPCWEVGVCLSDDGFKQFSFVNGTFTFKGGKHVDYVTKKLIDKISELIEKKMKITVKSETIKEGLFVFVKSQIVNPSFDSQSKETLTTSVTKFGSRFEFSQSFFDKLVKMGVIEKTIARHEFKENKKSQKTLLKKRGGRLYGIPKLEDAYEADGPNREKCTLILTEGDSAKSMAVSGLSVVGRDYYGVFPLRGKIINVRDKQSTVKGREQISQNEELNHLLQILGLEIGKEYTDLSELRYGHVMIMTDQDVDGSHIKGLFMNWVATYWPSLLGLGFITAMITPIIKATKGKTCLSFYSVGQYGKWKEEHEHERGWKIKYYKGLGTSTATEAKEYFTNMKKVDYVLEDQSCEMIDLAFNRDRTDDRKMWLKQYNIENVLDSSLTHVSFEQFINLDLIQFSHYDVHRSIPSVVDGFKPSQRKILYSWYAKDRHEEIKVAQFSGSVSEVSGYHHGEESLNKAIIAMAQDFVGSNNLNVLLPKGQFGTRLKGGSDAASPRYIYTQLNPVVEKVFINSDKDILNYLNDDGTLIEPEFYVPILPMILLNGANGIGTGYSTTVPCFNPVDVANQFITKLNGGEFSSINPYYKGFTGEIIQLSANSFLTKGKYRIKNYKTIEITELPIGKWTDEYNEFLESLLFDVKGKDGKLDKMAILKAVKQNSTEEKVNFEIEIKPEILKQWIKTQNNDAYVDNIEKELQLTSKFTMSNMHLFDETNHIRKYNNVVEIMDNFYGVRYEYYVKRKTHLLGKLRHQIDVLEQKVRFLGCVINKEIDISRQTVEQLEMILKDMGFMEISTGQSEKPSYDYLIDIKLRNITTDTYSNLCRQLENRLAEYETINITTIEDMWKSEITEFLDSYNDNLRKFESSIQEGGKISSSNSATIKRKVVKKVVKK